MSKKVSELQKKQIKSLFIQGISILEISKKFQFSTQTITRQLKIILGEIEFNKFKKKLSIYKQTKKDGAGIHSDKVDSFKDEENIKEIDKHKADEGFLEQSFFEVPPLIDEMMPEKQKDLSSIPISEIKLPNLVYMIVDRKIELEIKLLKDFPVWHFLSENDLNRKTIEIFDDLKVAKRACTKDQKVIKVPNTDVFKITAPILLTKGITRIVKADQLIAL